MLTVNCPEFCKEEISYTLDTVLQDRLGLKFTKKFSSRKSISLEEDGCEILLQVEFFEQLAKGGKVSTEEIEKLASWDKRDVNWPIQLTGESIPVLFGEPVIEQASDLIKFKFDILGTVFFMLTRYEEIDATQLDQYGRFPAVKSLAYRCGFLMRPIADEYIEILWAAIKQLWPNQIRKEESFNVVPTHDVDRPFLNITFENYKMAFRRMLGDLIKRKNPLMMLRTLNGWIGHQATGELRYKKDSFDVFDRLLSISKKHRIKNKFYFMAVKENCGATGGRYDISHPIIKELVKEISDQGHEIGLHPTGESYMDIQSFKRQANTFFDLKKEFKIVGNSGGRQHYLLWKHDITATYWEECGFEYDSTLSYSDHVGFRCGTCKEFYLWHHKRKQKLRVKERPLIMMEGSLLSQSGMGMNHDEARKTVNQLKTACKTVDGSFVFLWHNSSFTTEKDWELYEFCLIQD